MKTDVDRGHTAKEVTKTVYKPKLTPANNTKRYSVLDEDDSDSSDSSVNSASILKQILSKAGVGNGGGSSTGGGSVEKEKKTRAGRPIRISRPKSGKSSKSVAPDPTDGTSSEESPLEKKGSIRTRSISRIGSLSKPKKNAQDESSESSLDDNLDRSRRSNGHQSKLNNSLRSSSHHNSLSNSARFHASLNGSLKWEDYDGDYMKVTVRKASKQEAGISLIKTEGKFILTKLPEHEKRISAGMQVLAINGDANLHTVSKANDLISRSPAVVVLHIAFNEPVENNWKCPCCGKSMNAEGRHSHHSSTSKKTTISGRGRTPTRNDEGSTVGSVVESVSESVSTAIVNNQAPPGQRLPKPVPDPRTRHLYNFDDFESDSDTDEKEVRKPPRPSISRYGANERFMVRVSKKPQHKDPGIKFFEHKGAIYVLEVSESGPFYSTAINKGDKVLSINGRKVALIKSATNAANLVEEKRSVNIFALRPDPENEDYKEAISNFPT